jgi:hypothetical protein
MSLLASKLTRANAKQGHETDFLVDKPEVMDHLAQNGFNLHAADVRAYRASLHSLPFSY